MSSIAELRIVTVEAAGSIAGAGDEGQAILDELAPDVLELDASGYCVVLVLESLGEMPAVRRAEEHGLAVQLTQKGAVYWVFDATNAAEVVGALREGKADAATLRAHAERSTQEDWSEGVDQLVHTAQALERSLRGVTEGTLGVLMVG